VLSSKRPQKCVVDRCKGNAFSSNWLWGTPEILRPQKMTIQVDNRIEKGLKEL
jgi:hypothetical protein